MGEPAHLPLRLSAGEMVNIYTGGQNGIPNAGPVLTRDDAPAPADAGHFKYRMEELRLRKAVPQLQRLSY